MVAQKTKRAVAVRSDSLSSDEEHTKRPAEKAKRPRKEASKTRAEIDLEKLVFGGDADDNGDAGNDIFSKMGQEISAFMESGSEESDDDADTESDKDMDSASDEDKDQGSSDKEEEDGDKGDSLFFVDTVRDKDMAGSESEATDGEDDDDSDSDSAEEDKESAGPKAAWVDNDTQNAQVALKAQSRSRKLRETQADDIVSGDVYEERLRQQFQKIHSVPKWAVEAETAASRSSAEDGDSDRIGGELLKSTKSLLSKSSSVLQPTRLDTVRVRNANQAAPSQSPVLSVQFHPSSSVLLTAGLDKTLRL
ncbi:U3 snoRNP protein, partial [Coemansia aciculifera]